MPLLRLSHPKTPALFDRLSQLMLLDDAADSSQARAVAITAALNVIICFFNVCRPYCRADYVPRAAD